MRSLSATIRAGSQSVKRGRQLVMTVNRRVSLLGAADAACRIRDGFQSRLGNVHSTFDAYAVDSLVDSIEGPVNLTNLVLRSATDAFQHLVVSGLHCHFGEVIVGRFG